MSKVIDFFGIDEDDLSDELDFFDDSEISGYKEEQVLEKKETNNIDDEMKEEHYQKKVIDSEDKINKDEEIDEQICENLVNANDNNKKEPISEAIDLLKAELENDYKTSIPAKPIIEYLISKCSDIDFAQRIKLKGKTVKRCLNYIANETKGRRKGVIEDQVLFGLAVDYYLIENRVFVSQSAKLLEDKFYDEHDKNLPAIPILEYLINKCEKDKEFADRVALKEKTFEECGKYVLQEVKKELNGNNGHLEDQLVYNMAVDYYMLDGDLIEKEKVTPTTKTKTKSKKGTSTATKSKVEIPDVKPVVVEKESPQMSLFGF